MKDNSLLLKDVTPLLEAARDTSRVSGLTHNFYRYPARFSPRFVSTAIQLFSKEGDWVLDPYMGGGTTIVEALSLGRSAIGVDLNSLSAFVTRVKTTSLASSDKDAVRDWATNVLPLLSWRSRGNDITRLLQDVRTHNMALIRSRYIRKIIAVALASVESHMSIAAKEFLRCALLKTSQWALDGRRTHVTVSQYKHRLADNTRMMLADMGEFTLRCNSYAFPPQRILFEIDAASLHRQRAFIADPQISLVVTSPPYPGVHVLYHRWQIDGRRESPAPYWIAGCQDGQGSSYYNFGDRRDKDLKSYFSKSLDTLRSISQLLLPGAYVVQMLAFTDPSVQLPRYLDNMQTAGFREVCINCKGRASSRIWRVVPNRKWHALLRGETSASREVVLIHRKN